LNAPPSIKQLPEKGTPEWGELKIAIENMRMPPAMLGVMGGPSVEQCAKIFDKYGLVWDEGADRPVKKDTALEPITAAAKTPDGIAEEMIYTMGMDNGCQFNPIPEDYAMLKAGIAKMLAAGCKFNHHEVEILTYGEETEQQAVASKWGDGGRQVHKALNHIFEGPSIAKHAAQEFFEADANRLHPEGCQCGKNGGGDCEWCHVYYEGPQEKEAGKGADYLQRVKDQSLGKKPVIDEMSREKPGAVCGECGRTVTEGEYSSGESSCCHAEVTAEEFFGQSFASKQASWTETDPSYPVQVVGVMNGKITPDGRGYQEFPNLAAAQAVFPDLDPNRNGKRFTWAMRGEIEGQPATRYETWEAERMYSA
jgi:hypothetical protein